MTTSIASSSSSSSSSKPREELIFFPPRTTRADIVAYLTLKTSAHPLAGGSGSNSDSNQRAHVEVPAVIYRSDLIPDWENGITLAELENSAVPVDMFEGFPTVYGLPFWNRLPHETAEMYQLFTHYLQQPRTVGARQLFLLCETHGATVLELKDHAREFYWFQRARAFDIFEQAASIKIRAIRARSIDEFQYNTSNSMIQAVVARLSDPAMLESMEPSDLLRAFDLFRKSLRESVGMDASGNVNSGTGSNSNSNNGGVVNVIAQNFSNISKSITDQTASAVDPGASTIQKLGDLLRNNPELIRSAEEIILNVSSNSIKRLESAAAIKRVDQD